ncbi:hypothetical protein [Vibrio sp. SCSIO 43136]|uniref:hypothetical protein n=1 Tax=Vibrio sp. SCSIO 43136 TaxID=2819101 RepID=UPI0020761011|nr:hypothetical protein [Vibrio sp. SCSIO 43136]USD64428.1 hypothetical protein J4N39_09960 [Vibrio sp. SCSIO 43136]
MFVLISIAILLACLWLLYRSSSNQANINQRKYHQLNQLRNLIVFCREHRAISHQIKRQDNIGSHSQLKKMKHIESNIRIQLDEMCRNALKENRQLFRIYAQHVEELLQEWQTMSIERNQVAHGKVVRHSMYLIDELVITWIIQTGSSEEEVYQKSWHMVIDGMDTLTQFRIAIANKDVGKLLRTADMLGRRLTKLNILSGAPIERPTHTSIQSQLDHCTDANISDERRYDLASDISAELFHHYDNVVNNVCESLYQPLPEPQYSYQCH